MREKKYVIYCATNAVNGKKYIGQSCEFEVRRKKHLLEAKNKRPSKKHNKCTAFSNAIRKHGWNSFSWEIIHECKSVDDSNYFEEYFIWEYNTLVPYGYNLKPGGNNHACHPESREKIRATLKKVGTILSNKGSAHPRYGWVPTQEERDNLSRQFAGINGACTKLTEEQVLAIYQAGLAGLDYDEIIDSLQLQITSKSTITNILHRRSWKDLLKDLPKIDPSKLRSRKKSEETRKKISLAKRGENSATAKLREEDVREIRASKDNGPTLAKRYGVSLSVIYAVRNFTRWKHVT